MTDSAGIAIGEHSWSQLPGVGNNGVWLGEVWWLWVEDIINWNAMCTHGPVLIPGPLLLSVCPACLLRAFTQENLQRAQHAQDPDPGTALSSPNHWGFYSSVALTQELHSKMTEMELGSSFSHVTWFKNSPQHSAFDYHQCRGKQDKRRGVKINPLVSSKLPRREVQGEQPHFSPLIWITFPEAWQVKTDNKRLVQHGAEKTQSSPAQAFLQSLSSSSHTCNGWFIFFRVGQTIV